MGQTRPEEEWTSWNVKNWERDKWSFPTKPNGTLVNLKIAGILVDFHSPGYISRIDKKGVAIECTISRINSCFHVYY